MVGQREVAVYNEIQTILTSATATLTTTSGSLKMMRNAFGNHTLVLLEVS